MSQAETGSRRPVPVPDTAASISVNCDNNPLWENSPASGKLGHMGTNNTIWLLDAVRFGSLTVIISYQEFISLLYFPECGQTQSVTLILTEHSVTVTSQGRLAVTSQLSQPSATDLQYTKYSLAFCDSYSL